MHNFSAKPVALDSAKQREFAVAVVRELRDAGFVAYWAGGCVRDGLLGRVPYDYDVATSARPPEIQRVFHRRKTLAMGAAFGVITVLGPRAAGQIEIATFRQDANYTDGRHPDRVEFSSPEEDAQRRDFTVNGMFFDPLENRVIDFVGGQADLSARVLRAIGEPRERFTEDKLRLLRAARFAAILGFELDGATLAAMQQMAGEIGVVSAERIAAEMRIMLTHPTRAKAVQLLQQSNLLAAIVPEVVPVPEATVAVLAALDSPQFALALAVLLANAPPAKENLAHTLGKRWKLARKEIDRAAWLLDRREALIEARRQPWSRLQPLLIHEGASDLLQWHAAQIQRGLTNIDADDLAFCREKLAQPRDRLDPPPLLLGSDLIALNIPRGPVFAKLLNHVRAAQLDGVVQTREEALKFATDAWRAEPRPSGQG